MRTDPRRDLSEKVGVPSPPRRWHRPASGRARRSRGLPSPSRTTMFQQARSHAFRRRRWDHPIPWRLIERIRLSTWVGPGAQRQPCPSDLSNFRGPPHRRREWGTVRAGKSTVCRAWTRGTSRPSRDHPHRAQRRAMRPHGRWHHALRTCRDHPVRCPSPSRDRPALTRTGDHSHPSQRVAPLIPGPPHARIRTSTPRVPHIRGPRCPIPLRGLPLRRRLRPCPLRWRCCLPVAPPTAGAPCTWPSRRARRPTTLPRCGGLS